MGLYLSQRICTEVRRLRHPLASLSSGIMMNNGNCPYVRIFCFERYTPNCAPDRTIVDDISLLVFGLDNNCLNTSLTYYLHAQIHVSAV